MHNDGVISLQEALHGDSLPALEVFEAPKSSAGGQGPLIRIVFPEFTCLCPRTGYPDFAAIVLLYEPAGLCLELKSWKLYLNAFRMVGTFHEAVCAHLFDTVTATLQPRWVLLAGDFFPRGNVDTTVLLQSPGPLPAAAAPLLHGLLIPRCATSARQQPSPGDLAA